jgi:hypothetical protein
VPQCDAFRLETRARELTVMASLRVRSPEAKGNRFSVTPLKARGGRSERAFESWRFRLETKRSCPEQGEAGRKPGGGLQGS